MYFSSPQKGNHFQSLSRGAHSNCETVRLRMFGWAYVCIAYWYTLFPGLASWCTSRCSSRHHCIPLFQVFQKIRDEKFWAGFRKTKNCWIFETPTIQPKIPKILGTMTNGTEHFARKNVWYARFPFFCLFLNFWRTERMVLQHKLWVIEYNRNNIVLIYFTHHALMTTLWSSNVLCSQIKCLGQQFCQFKFQIPNWPLLLAAVFWMLQYVSSHFFSHENLQCSEWQKSHLYR